MAVLVQKVHDLLALIHAEAVDALLRNAELFVGLAQVYALVRTGFLRDHIFFVVEGESVSVTSEAPYAAFVEAKVPYMAPAWAQVQPQLESELKAIQQRIDKHFEQ